MTTANLSGMTATNYNVLAVAANPAKPVAGEIGFTGTTFLYDKNTYTFVTGYVVGQTTSFVKTVNGEITTSGLANNDVVFILLKDVDDNYCYFLGKVTVDTNITALKIQAASAASIVTPAAVANIVKGAITYDNADVQNLKIRYVSGSADTIGTAAKLNVTSGAPVLKAASNGIIDFEANFVNGDKVVAVFTGGESSNTTYYVFIGSVAVTATAYDTTAAPYKLIGFDCETENSVTFNTNGYSFVSAYAYNATTLNGTSASAGIVTFDGNLVSNDKLVVVLLGSDGIYYMYQGTATVVNKLVTALTENTILVPTNAAKVVTTETTANSGEIKSAVAITVTTNTCVNTITNYGTMAVNGNVDITFINANVCGVIDNHGIIDVSGMIEYQVAKAATSPLTAVSESNKINAASYSVSPATTSTQNYMTYYYTTLKNAMTASDNITVYGTCKILEDTTLTGNSTATPVANKITIAANSEIVIGVAEADDVEPVVANVTLPTTTKLSFVGKVVVDNGKFIVEDVKIADYSTLQVEADVIVVSETSKVYTDVVTALNEAVSGETVKLRQNASFGATVTVISGVILDGNGNSITVPAGVILTVDGEVKNVMNVTVDAATEKKTAGGIVLNTNKFAYSGTFSLAGSLTFGTAYDNTAATSVAFGVITVNSADEDTPATITVNGKLKIGSAMATASGAGYVIIGVAGELTVPAGAFENVSEKVTVTGTLSATGNVTIADVTVLGTGSVASTTSAIISVYKLVSGTPAKDMKDNTNGTTVKVTVNTAKGTVTIYGKYTAANVVVKSDASTNAAVTAYYLNEDIVYATIFAKVTTPTNGVGNSAVAILAIADPEITGYTFYAWYTAPSYATPVVSTNMVGDYAKVYGKVVVKTFSVTFGATQNGHWIVNGVDIGSSGVVEVPYGSATIEFVADNGYTLKDYSLLLNDKAMPLDYQPTTGDKITFAGTVEKSSDNGGMDLVTILLIIITIVIIIMAIIIALKLLRS